MDAHEFLAGHRADLIDELSEWIRVPSVATVPEHATDVLRSAKWLAGALRAAGFPRVETWADDDAPAVYAEWCAAPDAPTILIYSHHDVRPTADEEWQETAPFQPALRDGYLYGRGASDAKGQVIAHLWGLRAHLAATGRNAPAVNVKLLVEGEEGAGSPHLAGLLDEHRPQADLIVFSDTLLWRRDSPAVCLSLRGVTNGELEISAANRPVHSGLVSGTALNPIAELSRIVSRLHDDKGRVTLPGFYDEVLEPAELFGGELGKLPYTEEDWLARTETGAVGGEVGYSPLERLWARPALEVLTVVAGDATGPARGAIPPVATASLSIRTVADQRIEEIGDQLRRWLDENVDPRFDHRLSLSDKTAQEPYRTPMDHPAVEALAEAMRDGFGAPAGRMGNAGGGPAALLAGKVGAPVVFFGTGLPEDRWHDSDERTSVDVLLAGAATLASLWSRLPAALGRG